MPGLQCEGTAVESPIRKNRLSLKFLQKKETKRALDFNEPQPEELSSTEPGDVSSCDQDVPTSCPSSVSCSKTENLVPFVGLNNLGNTCYLNSILQVLYYCPGFKEAVKSLFQLSKSKDKQKEDGSKTEEETPQESTCEDALPVHMELLHSFYSLISSVEQLQSSFLFNPEKYSEGELATPPRRILSTLRQLNPMYEGYLQHDAQEVLQCILAYIQEACDTIKKELNTYPDHDGVKTLQGEEDSSDGQQGGKRKSDTEVGNAKKKPKSNSKPKKSEEDSRPVTRSKRKSSDDGTGNSLADPKGPAGKEQEEVSRAEDEKSDATSKEESTKRKKRVKLSWLRPSSRQPSIFSKFRSMGRISAHVGDREENKDSQQAPGPENESTKNPNPPAAKEEEEEVHGLNMLKRLFQGQLVLRTRCLECECCTERREDFQDISVPVQEDEPGCSDCSSEVSPDPKPEQKTLKWAISQFASVERIVGEDKYFCETCHHYAEAERSLLFDRTPDVVTIHLKCFSASGSEMDPYAGLSKVNTPLLTPLKLSLKEWSTGSCSPHHYRLFAVVMHSGVTISSGHYTTYIRMSDLHRTELKLQSEPDHDSESRSVKKEEATPTDYDDGEVSFSVSAKAKSVAMAAKAGAKRVSEGVGLLGGQRSASSYEITNSSKAVGVSGCPAPVKKEREEVAQVSGDSALQNLLDYEGKWMLFDDSEVRLFEEEEFLRACSPETSSTSTPYLLFYHKVSGDMD